MVPTGMVVPTGNVVPPGRVEYRLPALLTPRADFQLEGSYRCWKQPARQTSESRGITPYPDKLQRLVTGQGIRQIRQSRGMVRSHHSSRPIRVPDCSPGPGTSHAESPQAPRVAA